MVTKQLVEDLAKGSYVAGDLVSEILYKKLGTVISEKKKILIADTFKGDVKKDEKSEKRKAVIKKLKGK